MVSGITRISDSGFKLSELKSEMEIVDAKEVNHPGVKSLLSE